MQPIVKCNNSKIQDSFLHNFSFYYVLFQSSDIFPLARKGIKTGINGILPLQSVARQGFVRGGGGGGRLETISRDLTKVSTLFSQATAGILRFLFKSSL